MVLFRRRKITHIFHDCLYVRLWRGDEHQSLFHHKYLMGNNHVKLAKTRGEKGKKQNSEIWHLLPSCQSRLLEKIVFVLEMLSLLRVDLEPRLHILCQRAVAHHEHLGVKNGQKIW